MNRNESIRNCIMAAIQQSGGHTSFDELMNISGLSFVELSSMIGMLLKEKQLVLSVANNNNRRKYRIRAEELFDKFIELLSEHFMHERSVKFYASELCISPKYLTTVIKQTSGKTATVWINNKVVNEIIRRLLYSQSSIKEIAYDLNFTNVSFFGKFFKARSGMSPLYFRKEYGVRIKSHPGMEFLYYNERDGQSATSRMPKCHFDPHKVALREDKDSGKAGLL
jgi:AraC-like DNA-binding protein